MANTSRVRGFVPIRRLDGTTYTGGAREMLCIGANENTALFIGDVVEFGGAAGTAGLVVSGRNTEGMPSVVHSTKTTTGDAIAGVIVGFVQDQTIPLKYNPASTNRIVLVEVARDVVYEVQEDGVGNNLAATDVGSNIGFNSAAGSTTTGLSAYSIDSSVTATTTTYPFRILGLVPRPDNAFGLSSTDLAKFEVVLNYGTGGVSA